LLAGLLACGVCGRRMESAWSNGKPAYRCRHGHTSATPPDPGRPKNAYVREDRILPRLPALHLLLTGTGSTGERRRRRTRRGADARCPASEQDVIGYLREHGITLIYDQPAGTLQAGTGQAAKTLIRKASKLRARKPRTGRRRRKEPPVTRRWRKPAPGRRPGMPGNRRIWGITVSEGRLEPSAYAPVSSAEFAIGGRS
jgi:hypothetical protein